MLTNAKLYLYGVILGVVGDTLKVPFIGEELSIRSKPNSEQETGLEAHLLSEINKGLLPIDQINGLEVTSSVSSGFVNCDFSAIMALDPTADDNEEVQNAIKDRVATLKYCFTQDENGRVVTVPKNPSEETAIELLGNVVLNENGAYMLVHDVTLSNGKSAHVSDGN